MKGWTYVVLCWLKKDHMAASGIVGLGTSLTHSHIVSQGSSWVMNMRHGAWISGSDIKGVEKIDKKDQAWGTREKVLESVVQPGDREAGGTQSVSRTQRNRNKVFWAGRPYAANGQGLERKANQATDNEVPFVAQLSEKQTPPCTSDLPGSHRFYNLNFKSACVFGRSTCVGMMECVHHHVLVGSPRTTPETCCLLQTCRGRAFLTVMLCALD